MTMIDCVLIFPQSDAVPMLSSVLQMSRAAYHAYKSRPHGAHCEFSATLMRQSCEAPPQSAFEPGANRGVAAGEKRDGSSTNTHIKLHARGLWARARNGITFLAPRLVRTISAGFVDRRADIKTAHFSFRTTHIKSCASTLTFEDRQTQSAALCECWLSRAIFTSSRCGMSADWFKKTAVYLHFADWVSETLTQLPFMKLGGGGQMSCAQHTTHSLKREHRAQNLAAVI